MSNKLEIPAKWQQLKSYTKARVALGNVGTSLPLNDVLALKHAHALAKDAILTQLDKEFLKIKAKEHGVLCSEFKSQVKDRLEYLKRPDLGRKLVDASEVENIKKVDIVIVITDGLSATAVNSNAFSVLDGVLPDLKEKFSICIALVEQGRVAIGDQVAEFYNADFVAVLIGERPGLSSPESMGIYVTYKPKIGFTDERRNCISNIHKDGLSSIQASTLLNYLIHRSFALKISGVELKIDLGAILGDE